VRRTGGELVGFKKGKAKHEDIAIKIRIIQSRYFSVEV